MTRVELAEATAPLADYARKAKRGPVVFTRKGRPVAMLRLLTDEEREDYLVSNHPGFVELIRRSRETYPPGTGIAIQEIERDLAANSSRRAPVRTRSTRRKS